VTLLTPVENCNEMMTFSSYFGGESAHCLRAYL
jgi:hypothetical protein